MERGVWSVCKIIENVQELLGGGDAGVEGLDGLKGERKVERKREDEEKRMARARIEGPE